MLVQAGLKEAGRMRLGTCVLAMRAALGVYQRAGFKLLDEVVQDASPFGGEAEYAAYFLATEVEESGGGSGVSAQGSVPTTITV